MDRKSREQSWPYVVLVVCLLALSFAAPVLWRARPRAPQAMRCPLANFSLWAISHERETTPTTIEDVTLHGVHRLHEAPALLKTESAPQTGPANTLAAADGTGWESLADPRSKPGLEAQPSSTGKRVAFGALVARNYDGDAYDGGAGDEEEILPPQAPQVTLNLAGGGKLQRANAWLAMRQASSPVSSEERASTIWPRPHALIAQLESIEGNARCQRWARDVLDELAALAKVDAVDSEDSANILQRLEERADEVDRFIMQVRPAERQARVFSARDGLARRVRIWRQVQAIARREERTQFVVDVAADEVLAQIDRAMRSIPGRKAPPAWREYLGLDALRETIANGPADVYQRAALAVHVLQRLNSPRLDKRQRELLDVAGFHRLQETLRRLATQPVDEGEIVYVIEQYEQSRTPSDARRLASATAALRWSTDEAVAELARRIDRQYRGRNVRVAITDDFLNRSLPPAQTTTEDVDEQILASYVTGQREIERKMFVELVPDDENWRITMKAEGTMASDTASYAGNATLLTQGSGRFTASKRILVDHHHINVYPAQAEADYAGQLYGVSTSLDAIPIISRIVQNTATQNYYQSQWAARQEIVARLKRRAAERLDEQAMEQLTAGEAQLKQRILRPLAKTGVEATPTQLTTTEERIVGRYRLAAASQLGGHTPRPWAPKNALLSMQIHESAINNVIMGIQLDGRQAHIRDLFREIYTIFGRDDYTPPASMPENVTLLFAEENAVRVSLQEGRMEIILQLAELRTDERIWRDLVVRNYYAPDPSSLEARLVRDSTVRLKGQRLGARDQVALRAIFTKVFGENRHFAIIPSEVVDNPGLDGLAVTQYVIRNGWLGIAIAPPHRGMQNEPPGGGPLERQARRLEVIFE